MTDRKFDENIREVLGERESCKCYNKDLLKEMQEYLKIIAECGILSALSL
jgi:hypothetical protein